MRIPGYKYPVDECSVPVVRRRGLEAYRSFRWDCLERLQGDADTSVLNQVLGLTWHTAVFRTLNEARRIEHDRSVNGAMWELITVGYANLVCLGVRRLVDRHTDTDSVWNVVTRVERRPELLTRENYVCHDGLPFDFEAVERKHIASYVPGSGARWLATEGPEAFESSRLRHEAFDGLCGYPSRRRPLDKVETSIFSALRTQLEHPTIEKVCRMVDRTIAHAERLAQGAAAVPVATYNDIDEALGIIARVAQFLSWNLLGEGGFGSIVATPQFDVLASLEEPWCKADTIPALQEHWYAVSKNMDDWVSTTEARLLPAKPPAAS